MQKTGSRGISEKSAHELRNEFLAHLEEKSLTEQFYQEYIENNTRLVPREFVQNHGIHFSLVFRKLALGADYKCDFAYLAKSSADWNCVLIEIEKPSTPFFREGLNEFHPAFLHAKEQILKWKAWFSSDSSSRYLLDDMLELVRVPPGMTNNPCHIKYVLVSGRRSEYYENLTRTRMLAAAETSDFKILSYDSLAEGLETKHSLYVAARRNEFVDILSDHFAGESMFAWMRPEQIQIGKKLKENILDSRDQWFQWASIDEMVMDVALPKVRVRSD